MLQSLIWSDKVIRAYRNRNCSHLSLSNYCLLLQYLIHNLLVLYIREKDGCLA